MTSVRSSLLSPALKDTCWSYHALGALVERSHLPLTSHMSCEMFDSFGSVLRRVWWEMTREVELSHFWCLQTHP